MNLSLSMLCLCAVMPLGSVVLTSNFQTSTSKFTRLLSKLALYHGSCIAELGEKEAEVQTTSTFSKSGFYLNETYSI